MTPEQLITCYWSNGGSWPDSLDFGVLAGSGKNGRYPPDDALDTSDPDSCGSWLLTKPPEYSLQLEQYSYRTVIVKQHESTVSLSWTAPTLNEDGSPIEGDLAGFNVYGGIDPDMLTKAGTGLTVEGGDVLTYETNDLIPGQWYFAVTAVDFGSNESQYSNIVTKPILP